MFVWEIAISFTGVGAFAWAARNAWHIRRLRRWEYERYTEEGGHDPRRAPEWSWPRASSQDDT